jgi:hypothetical protein
MREKKFNDYRHMKLIIRLPVGNNTDVIDDRDMQVAKELLLKEWLQLRDEVDHFFSVIQVEKKPLRLP